MKTPRNHLLEVIAKEDPARYRTRTVETEKSKLQGSRARRKQTEAKEMRQQAAY